MRFRQGRVSFSQDHPDLRYSRPSTMTWRASPRETVHFGRKRFRRDLREAGTMLNRRSGYEYEDLLACGRGELFGPGNAQLPLPPMLMFDRISEISETGGGNGKGPVRARIAWEKELLCFWCHFKRGAVIA